MKSQGVQIPLGNGLALFDQLCYVVRDLKKASRETIRESGGKHKDQVHRVGWRYLVGCKPLTESWTPLRPLG
jgi:hypothetical protein